MTGRVELRSGPERADASRREGFDHAEGAARRVWQHADAGNQDAFSVSKPESCTERTKALIQECGWKGGDSGDSVGKKQRDQQIPKRIPLTPTGLLMEAITSTTPVNECNGDFATTILG